MNRRHPGGIVRLAIACLVVEFLVAGAALVALLVELGTAPAGSMASAVALTVLAALAVVWMGAMILGLGRGRPWVRGSAVVWQVLQFAVGVSSLTGAGPQPLLGWPLLVLAAITFGLLISPPLAAALGDRAERPGRP